MPTHKGEDYKISAVQYYLDNKETYVKTCEIFKCSERSLKRWIERYQKDNEIKRNNRQSVSYKVTQEQVDFALKLLKKNEQISMEELSKSIKDKYKEFDITPQWLGKVIRDNNKTRKRTRHKHFPKKRYRKPIDKQEELDKFYKEINKYSLNKIISIDETSIKPSMMKEYSRCEIGQRCIVKTDDNIVFQKFTLVVAMSNSKCVGYKLYEKGGMIYDTKQNETISLMARLLLYYQLSC
jgi:transposase-like protein